MKRYVTLLLVGVVAAAAAPAAGQPAPKAPAAKQPAGALPGSSLSVAEALRDGYDFVAICQATDEARVQKGKLASPDAVQTFTGPEKLLAGKIAAKSKTLRVVYFLVDAGGRREQPIKKGQRIIWIARAYGRSCLGVKAVLDTPANRQAVAGAVKEANEEIEAAINALVAVLRLQTPKGWQLTLAKGQVQPQGLRKAEGVSISMEPKVAGPGKGQGTFLWLMSSTYQIPQQVSLQMAFWRGRQVLYRSADARMPSEAIRAAINATARVPGAIDVRRGKAGSYVGGKWKYVLERRGLGSRGALLYMGIPIHADFDRLVRTPWGYMRNVPSLRTMRGPSGWLPLGGFDRFNFQSRDEFVISFDATKIDAKASRLYASGPWAYSSGFLTCGGKAVPVPKNVGDYYVTPWGKIFWTGRRALWAVGYKGKAGKELPPPASLPQALEPQRKKWQKAATTQPGKAAKLDLDATVKLLTKRVGGKWQKGAHNAFLQTKRVVRGHIYAATDKVLVRYIVYPLELFEGRPPVLSTLRMCGNAEILGLSPACVVTVFSTAPADKLAPYSRAVTKALGLKPPKVTRRVCMAALRKMQKDFAALAAKYPKELGHLGPGAIDEKKLLLRFPVKNLPKTTQPAQRATPAGRMRTVLRRPRPDELGLFVQFTAPMSPKAGAGRWLHLNVSFAWRWMWPNRPFSWKAQQDLIKMLSQALVPLNDLENATIAADLAKRQKGSYVLRGRPGVKLTTQLSPRREAAGTVVDFYATNETKGVLALYPPFTQIIGDGKPWHYRAPGSLSMLTRAFGSDRDPFIYIKPGQTAKVGTVVVAGLSAGRHTVRVAAGHPYDYWVDMRPTFHDGSPVARKVPGAWTGVLVSGELAVDIPAPAQPAVKWGKAVGGLVCGISAFKPKVQVGVPYQFEVSVKNVSKRDILLLKQRFTKKFPQPPLVARLFLLAGGKKYPEGFTFDSKCMAAIPARKEDFVLLKPNDIYKFTRRTLIYPRSMAKKYWGTEVNLGHMAVSREGAHQMQVRYEAWGLPIAKGVDLGGLKPWKGVLLSAPVEVVVGKAEAKGKAS